MCKLYLMCGIPGSGKSTWLKNHAGDGVVVSRDVIRFSMVKEDEEYFSKENEVFAEFVRQINENLSAGKDVFADATHLNPASRNKLLNQVSGYDEVHAIVMLKTCDTALKQNENRIGTRAYVPRSVIRRMANQLHMPRLEEGFKSVIVITEEEKVTITTMEV